MREPERKHLANIGKSKLPVLVSRMTGMQLAGDVARRLKRNSGDESPREEPETRFREGESRADEPQAGVR